MSWYVELMIAIGVVFNEEKKILVALRPKDKLQGGLWEFPGGKVESGETVEEALKRELLEEVGIHITEAKPFIQCSHSYHEHHVLLDVWCVYAFEGEAHGREKQPIAWVTLDELAKLPMLSANHPILEALKSGSAGGSPAIGRYVRQK